MSDSSESSSPAEDPTDQPAAAATTFHPFPRLPDEISLNIIRMALEEPRLVRLIVRRYNGVYTFDSNYSRPAIFYTNQKWRNEAQNKFTLRLSIAHNKPPIHFNFGVDTLYLSSRSIPQPILVTNVLRLVLPGDIRRVNLLAVDVRLQPTEEEGACKILDCFFGRVQHFTIIHSEVFVPTLDTAPNGRLDIKEAIAMVDVMHVTERLRFTQMLIQDYHRLIGSFRPERQAVPYIWLTNLAYKPSKTRFIQVIREDLGPRFLIPEYKQKLVTSARVAEDLQYQIDFCKEMGQYIHKEWTYPWFGDEEDLNSDSSSVWEWDPGYGVEEEDIYINN
jgi:hypothetical protein